MRTKQAEGEGNELRLVLLEAFCIGRALCELDEWIAERTAERGLDVALDGGETAMARLEAAWRGLDLEECTLRMREVDELLRMLAGDLEPPA